MVRARLAMVVLRLEFALSFGAELADRRFALSRSVVGAHLNFSVASMVAGGEECQGARWRRSWLRSDEL